MNNDQSGERMTPGLLDTRFSGIQINVKMASINLRKSLTVLLVLFASGAHAQIPAFIPSYYSEALILNGRSLVFTSQSEKDGIRRAVFMTDDRSIGLSIDHVSCDRPQCAALLDQNLKRHNTLLASNAGNFLSVSPSEYAAAWNENSSSFLLYFAKLPGAVEVWTRVSTRAEQLPEEPFLSAARRAMNRRRFEEASQAGNVEVGVWSSEAAQYARDLRAAGKKDDAGRVLSQVVNWAPTNFEAQMDFAESTANAAAARASAVAVWENAEDEKTVARAARLLDRSEPKFEELPVLEQGLKGPLVVLIPLPPCDIRLVEEAARLYASSLNMPVKIARLPDVWSWGAPDRVFRERDLRAMFMQKAGTAIDFTGWTKARYASELVLPTVKDDPLTRYRNGDFLKTFADKPGQYLVEPYLAKLGGLLRPVRSDDRRTIFVGITGADIFSGDLNYLFSGAEMVGGSPITILSYARMLAAATGERSESHQRLVQRLAKEMVPAALKQIGIPRPADPTDPYSYSDGLDRLDQKTLTLSQSTREALDRFRTP
jgi:predicted Zn-dependent protease